MHVVERKLIKFEIYMSASVIYSREIKHIVQSVSLHEWFVHHHVYVCVELSTSEESSIDRD